MKSSYSKDIICPFYAVVYAETNEQISEMRRSIKCEGLYQSSSITQFFVKECVRENHRQRYCASFDWEQCPIAKMLNKTKYGDTK